MTSPCLTAKVVMYLLLAFTAAIYFDDKHFQDYGNAEVVLTQVPQSQRSRRSADYMPQEIDVTVTSAHGDVSLRLRRNLMADLEVPVYTIKNGEFLRRKIQRPRGSGFYQDVATRASLRLSALDNNLRTFDLEGPLTINGSQFLLTPSSDLLSMNANNCTRRAHKLKRLMTTVDFGDDFLDERRDEDKQLRGLRALRRQLRRQGQRQARGKRQAAVTHTVELTIVTDYEIYDRFMKFAKGNSTLALSEMRLYYLFVANLMDIRYKSVTVIDPTLIIRVALISLVVADTRQESVWTERNKLSSNTIDAERALYAFRNWLRVSTNIPKADHWMLFSGYDLAEASGSTGTIGIAFIGTLCTNSAVSVIEEYLTATSGAVSAHELGHSLDADHDSSYRTCSDATSNVMSTVAVFPSAQEKASNPWKFSQCSVDAFGAYLDSVQCALHPPTSPLSTNEVAGLYLNADEQCALALGQGSYFCRTVQQRIGLDMMCRKMYCFLPDEPGYCSSIVPQEYTSCNNRQWCQLGICTTHSVAPATIPNCPQGDDPNYNCATANCADLKVRDAYCCRTCAERRGVTVAPGTAVTAAPLATSRSPPPPAATTALSTARTTMRPSTTKTALTTPRPTPYPPSTGCTTLECTCRYQFTLYCFFYYRG